MEEFLAVLFILENITFVGVGFFILMTRLRRDRKEKRREEEAGALGGSEAREESAGVRDEIAQLREMMADILLDAHPVRATREPADTLAKSTQDDR